MMMKMKNDYELVISQKNINFAPATLLDEVSQNIITICTTQKFSVPMDRIFGVDTSFLDEPIPAAKAKFCSEIVRAVKRFEKRAKVTAIDFSGDDNGHVYPHIFFRLVS